jgi:4-hydroxy-tetrahydrodipicolinate reductase
MAIKVCLAGATGWAGSALARGIAQAPDLALVAAVSRAAAGRTLGDALNDLRLAAPVYGSAAEALAEPCDVFVEYTHPSIARANVLAALAAGAHVVIGTSGLTDADYTEIDMAAQAQGRGVLACGNFSLTAVLLQKFAATAARLIPQWEIVEYAQDTKSDAPSGTTRELAWRLAQVRAPQMTVPLEQTIGPRESRGATIAGSQVHAVRLPGHVIAVDVIFGLPDQKLVIHHDAGASAQPYVDGALLAIRKVSTLTGLHRGLDTVLDL